MEICVKNYFVFHIFFILIASDALILPISQFQAQQVMTSQLGHT